jgi:hypothetical protein
MDNWEKPANYNANNINIHENYEVEYWTKALGTNTEELKKAVAAAGNTVAAIKRYLKK